MAVEELVQTVEVEKKHSLILVDTGLVIVSALVFSLAFPGLMTEKGMSLAAFLFFIPLVPVLSRCSWIASLFYGWLHAYLSYALFNYWLADFHPLTIVIVPLVYVGWYSILFPLLKAALVLFPRRGYLLQPFIWVAFEFLKSRGFLGYPYGTVGSAFYELPLLVRVSSLTGIWGLSLLALLAGAWAGGYLLFRKHDDPVTRRVLRRGGIGIALYAFVLLLYGFFSAVDCDSSPRMNVALTQHNADSWQGGYTAFRDNYFQLRELSLQAQEEGSPDLIVWPETAFVPTIYYHKTYRLNKSSLSLVEDLESFLASQDIPYLIGNDDARRELSAESGEYERVDYNAALLYRHGEWRDLYRKRHLVPFTEHFPYEKEFPLIYQALVDADTHFWKKGDDFNVIDTGLYKIGTPICFEDTFGYISRAFVLKGADLIVNLSNDAWSGSVVAERQHFMLSVFRAGENRRTMVRSTNAGITAWVDPNGVIREELPPFIPAVMTASVPVYTETRTLYTLWGDWFAWFCLAAVLMALLAGIAGRLTIHLRSRKIEEQVCDRGQL